MMPSVYELEWRAREREREIQEGLRVARLLEGVERRSLWSRISRLWPARSRSTAGAAPEAARRPASRPAPEVRAEPGLQA